VRGNLTVALLQVIVSGIGFTIFGVPNALIWSICVGIASLAPGIGTPVFYFGATAYLLAVGSTIPGIGMLIWSVLAIIIVDNIIGPKLIGGKAELHPILVLISVLGGLSFFGPSGIFLGPLVISVLVGLLEIYAPEPRTSA
jgi:predicted PurR-regulated permease PerM